jgi:hypothetical protein
VVYSSMPFIIQVILVLAVLGFCFYLFNKHVPIASPFREMIYFVVVVACIWWILEGFGIVHTHVLPHWRR